MKKVIYLIKIIAVSFVFVGCGQGSNRKKLNDGYEEVTLTRTSLIGEPALIQTRLEYRGAGKSAVIWPVVRSDIFIKDGVAAFVGDRSEKWSTLDQRWETGTHLFVVKGPGVPVDVTSELVGRWSRDSGKDSAQAIAAACLIGGKTISADQLSFYFEFNGGLWPGVNMSVSGDQLLDMMREVNATGAQRKDPLFHVTYMEKEIK